MTGEAGKTAATAGALLLDENGIYCYNMVVIFYERKNDMKKIVSIALVLGILLSVFACSFAAGALVVLMIMTIGGAL